MLLELHVKDLALVDEVWLEFGEGLTVLTGETGAGKTVLVGALKLLIGERADASQVRSGAQEALVEGRFLIDGEEHVVKRRIGADGRSRCTIDGEMATVGALADLLGPVVDLHGQHEHQALLVPSRHAGYLDRFIGKPALDALEAYRAAYAEHRVATEALAALECSLVDRDRRANDLRFIISTIDAVAPKAGEDEELEASLPRLRHAERLGEAVGEALEALRGDGGAQDDAARAAAALARIAAIDPSIARIEHELGELVVMLDDLGGRLRSYAEAIECDPEALENAERRLAELRDLKRRFGPTLEDVVATRDQAAAELAVLDAGEAGVEEARARVAAAAATMHGCAQELVRIRRSAIPAFEEALEEAMRELALPAARFAVVVDEPELGAMTASDPSRVEFLFAASGTDDPRPLARIASGGEISRVMLALKSVLGAADRVPVLIFDEIDAGIGGATALAVGRRLCALASSHQVLVVTHLAQVAAFADGHVVVEKRERDGRGVTDARTVTGDERLRELARMLSGSTAGISVEHARELLTEARASAGLVD